MCCGYFSYPTSVGYIIRSLKPGDQVIILAGEGYPHVAQETTDIIWQVAGFSALTAGGISLSCQANTDLIPTGNHFDDYLVSDLAKSMWKQVRENTNPDEPDSEPE